MRYHRARRTGRGAILAATLTVVAVLAAAPWLAAAQQPPQCQTTAYIENKTRRLTGAVDVECNECIYWPIPMCHSAPYGNWGVDSNLQSRTNDDQFRGWKNLDGHGQWNSCTSTWILDEYNNDPPRKQKASPDDIQIAGWRPEARGRQWRKCKDFVPEVYELEDVEMDLWELDWPGGDNHDDNVTTLEYGDFSVSITCTGDWECAGESSWRAQNSTDSTGVTSSVRVRYKAIKVPSY